MNRHPKALGALLLITVFSLGCSTDLEINAPYRNITVVYGLLGQKDADNNDVTRHWVKINRAFLGEGDALVFASIPDSTEFTDEQLELAQVEEYQGSTLTNTYTLMDTILNDRVPGVFNYPVHKIYFFNASLNPDRTYRVVVKARGETTIANTNVVKDFQVNNTDGNVNVAINLMGTTPGTYGFFELNWSTGPNGKRYDTYYRCRYAEVRGTDTTERSLTRLMAVRVATGTNGNESMASQILGEDFYKSLAIDVTDDPTITKRIFWGIDLLFQVANEDFHTYLQLASPITSIVEDRPQFTNVQNGQGLVASRLFKTIKGKKLNGASLQELTAGQHTGGLLFCAGFPSDYSCN
ncbi:MAG: hypothetical protein JNM31_12785 [Flavobacteriales bacterium]|nr:hypothetical protein [Flavobacteriales bacterium]